MEQPTVPIAMNPLRARAGQLYTSADDMAKDAIAKARSRVAAVYEDSKGAVGRMRGVFDAGRAAVSARMVESVCAVQSVIVTGVDRVTATTEVARKRVADARDIAVGLATSSLDTATRVLATLDITARTQAALEGTKNHMAAGRTYMGDQARFARERAQIAMEQASARATKLRTGVGETVSQKSFQATAAASAGGAVFLGAGGGAAGLATGAALGAASGLPLALFTFGLSIPVGAALGGGTGLVVGTTVGATTGAVSGGAAGYGVYSKRDEIRNAAGNAMLKAGDSAEIVRGKAATGVTYMKDAALAARSRLLRPSTGGSGEAQD